jgi:hypothetical protein
LYIMHYNYHHHAKKNGPLPNDAEKMKIIYNPSSKGKPPPARNARRGRTSDLVNITQGSRYLDERGWSRQKKRPSQETGFWQEYI